MHRLEPEEAAVLALLQAQLAAQAQKEDLVGRLEASLKQTRRKPVKKARVGLVSAQGRSPEKEKVGISHLSGLSR
jgi:hypothetical protein